MEIERNNNIIVIGLEEKETTFFELLQNLKENIKKEDHEINNIFHLVNKNITLKKNGGQCCGPFNNSWKKIEIIKNKNLKKIYITEDYYPKDELGNRKEFQVKLIEERKKAMWHINMIS